MKANEIKLAVSPMTNTIYAGKLNVKGTEFLDKLDVTEQTLSAVAQYMDGTYTDIHFPSGTLKWVQK
jgi:hypothetical protein